MKEFITFATAFRTIVLGLLIYISVVMTDMRHKLHDMESYLDSLYLEVNILSGELERQIDDANYSTRFLFDLLQQTYRLEQEEQLNKQGTE